MSSEPTVEIGYSRYEGEIFMGEFVIRPNDDDEGVTCSLSRDGVMAWSGLSYAFDRQGPVDVSDEVVVGLLQAIKAIRPDVWAQIGRGAPAVGRSNIVERVIDS